VDATAHGGLGGGEGWGNIMMPVHVSAQGSPQTSVGGKGKEGTGATQTSDDDEEWGW
jgi:hypothetical protein